MPSAPDIDTSRREAWQLGLLFGALYFIMGVTEPTEGIVAQPVRSLMLKAGDSTATVTLFASLLMAPWCLKPLYGLCSDFVPWLGMRRKNYLLVTSAAAAIAFLALAYVHPVGSSSGLLLLVLLVPTTSVAWADVVVDALMVETGKPRGLTVIYALVGGPASLGLVSLFVGLLHMSGTMAQLDLAARSCPLRVAGTVFATLMALSNVSVLLATTLGGQVYDLAAARWNTPTAFNILLIFGTLTTAACWLLMPRLPTQVDYAPAEID